MTFDEYVRLLYRRISIILDPVCSLAQYDNHLYSSSNKCLKVWDIETLQLFNEIATDTCNGWLRVLMQKDKCIYAGCRRGIKVNGVRLSTSFHRFRHLGFRCKYAANLGRI